MYIKHSRSRTGENLISFVSWTDELGRPLSNVEDVRYTLFAYDGINKVLIEENLLMTVSDETHRYFASITIPEGYEGKTLHVDFKCVYQADMSELRGEEHIQIDPPLNQQTLKVSF